MNFRVLIVHDFSAILNSGRRVQTGSRQPSLPAVGVQCTSRHHLPSSEGFKGAALTTQLRVSGLVHPLALICDGAEECLCVDASCVSAN